MVQFDRGQLMHFALGSLGGIGLKKSTFEDNWHTPHICANEYRRSFRGRYLYTRFRFLYGPQLKNTEMHKTVIFFYV